MKKVSAFSVFSAKSKRTKAMTELQTETTPDPQDNNERRSMLRRAASTPTVPDDVRKESTGNKGKKLLKVLKGGSLRSTFRGQKARPSVLPNAQTDSPYVANDAVSNGIELTGLKKSEEYGSLTSMKSVGKKSKNSPNGKSKSQPSPRKQKESADELKAPTRVTRTSSPTKRRLESPELPTKKKKKDEQPKSEETKADTEEVADEANRELDSTSKLPYMFDSSKEAKKLFECIIHPVKLERFFSELWERKPLLIKRHIHYYNDGWFSTAELDHILRQENIQYSVNLDITSYENGKRETHNPVGRAYAPVVWDYYQSGCSVRLLNPQTYSRRVWKLLSVLQEYFGCCVGANVYLTPPGTQGFAPHFDDIEAFILQLEGRKNWKLYSPKTESGTLPRFSSDNFNEEEIGEPILNIVLDAGDLLYFPRGTIHQASALEDTHSLHITVSCYQKNSWYDLMEKLMPRALQVAFEEDIELRQGLPKDYLQHMGVVNSDKETPERKFILSKVNKLLTSLIKHAPIDAAFDQIGKQFIHDSLPPVLSEAEKACSIHGTGERWDSKRNQVTSMVEIEPDTMVKIIRQGAIRLVMEEDQVHVYHTLENSRIYHGAEPQFVEIPVEAAPAVEFLIHAYPDYVSVDSLPLDDIQLKIDIATALYEKGLLLTQEPLEPMYEDDVTEDGKSTE